MNMGVTIVDALGGARRARVRSMALGVVAVCCESL